MGGLRRPLRRADDDRSPSRLSRPGRLRRRVARRRGDCLGLAGRRAHLDHRPRTSPDRARPGGRLARRRLRDPIPRRNPGLRRSVVQAGGFAMNNGYRRLETKVIHAGEPEPRILGAVAMPIFQSAMFEYAGETDYHDLKYIRLSDTPNATVLHGKLAALENAEAALVTASGMAAISTTLLAVLSSGDHLLAQDCLYGGTHDFVTEDFASFGIGYDFIDGEDPASWKKKLRPNTRAVY